MPLSHIYDLFLFCVCVPVSMHVNAHEDQRALNPPELELQEVISSIWMLETEPQSSAKAPSARNHGDISPALINTQVCEDVLILLSFSSSTFPSPLPFSQGKESFSKSFI